MRELEKIQHMIDEETEVFAVAHVGNNDYLVLPTRYTSVTYTGKEPLINAYTSAVTAIEPWYEVKAVFSEEVDAVKYLREAVRPGAATRVLIELYKYKYPELYI